MTVSAVGFGCWGYSGPTLYQSFRFGADTPRDGVARCVSEGVPFTALHLIDSPTAVVYDGSAFVGEWAVWNDPSYPPAPTPTPEPSSSVACSGDLCSALVSYTDPLFSILPLVLMVAAIGAAVAAGAAFVWKMGRG